MDSQLLSVQGQKKKIIGIILKMRCLLMKDQVVSPELGLVFMCSSPLINRVFNLRKKMIHSEDQYTIIEADIIGGIQCKLEYSEENQYNNLPTTVYEPIKTQFAIFIY